MLLISLPHHLNAWVAPHVLFPICCFWDAGLHLLLVSCHWEKFYVKCKSTVIWLRKMSLKPLSEQCGVEEGKTPKYPFKQSELTELVAAFFLVYCSAIYFKAFLKTHIMSMHFFFFFKSFMHKQKLKPSLKYNNNSLDPCFKRFH